MVSDELNLNENLFNEGHLSAPPCGPHLPNVSVFTVHNAGEVRCTMQSHTHSHVYYSTKLYYILNECVVKFKAGLTETPS